MLLNAPQQTRICILAFVIALVFFYADTVHAQLFPVPLTQRIENASTILEGKVVSQTAYWDDAQTHIYTANIVDVYKVFKGTFHAKRVEIITRGGIVGNKMERISIIG